MEGESFRTRVQIAFSPEYHVKQSPSGGRGHRSKEAPMGVGHLPAAGRDDEDKLRRVTLRDSRGPSAPLTPPPSSFLHRGGGQGEYSLDRGGNEGPHHPTSPPPRPPHQERGQGQGSSGRVQGSAHISFGRLCPGFTLHCYLNSWQKEPTLRTMTLAPSAGLDS